VIPRRKDTSMPSLNDFAPVGAPQVVDLRQAHYQELKERIHRTLLNRLNLDRLNRVGREQAEPEIRGLIVSLLDAERASMPLSLFERPTSSTSSSALGPSRCCWPIPPCRTSW